jgi:hypothetical protein
MITKHVFASGRNLLAIAIGMFVLVATVALTRVASGSPAQGGWQPYTGIPPVELQGLFGKHQQVLEFSTGAREFSGAVHIDTAEKVIRVDWYEKNSEYVASQALAVAFWPTDACVLVNKQDLIVSGKERFGDTVIEKWELDPPQLLYQGVPGGGGHYIWTPATIANIDSLHNASVQGQDMVYNAAPDQFSSNRVYVTFWDSKELCLIDFANPQQVSITRIAAPSSGALLQQPELTFLAYREMFWSANHSVHGHVYVLNAPHTEQEPIVFFDADRNGVMDSSLALVADQWSSMGLADGTAYIE